MNQSIIDGGIATPSTDWKSMPQLPSWDHSSWGAESQDTTLSMNRLPNPSKWPLSQSQDTKRPGADDSGSSSTTSSLDRLPSMNNAGSPTGITNESKDGGSTNTATSNVTTSSTLQQDASKNGSIQQQLTTLVMLQNQQLQVQQEQLKTQRNKIEELREELHLEKESRRRQTLLLQSMAQSLGQSGNSVGGGDPHGPGGLRQPYHSYNTPQQQWMAQQQHGGANAGPYAAYGGNVMMNNAMGGGNSMRGSSGGGGGNVNGGGGGGAGQQLGSVPYGASGAIAGAGMMDYQQQIALNALGGPNGYGGAHHPRGANGGYNVGGGETGVANYMPPGGDGRGASPYGHEQLPQRLEFDRATGEWVEIGQVHGHGHGEGGGGSGSNGNDVGGGGNSSYMGMDPRATGFVPSSPEGRTGGGGNRKVLSSTGVVQNSGHQNRRNSGGRNNKTSVIDSEKILSGKETRTTL